MFQEQQTTFQPGKRVVDWAYNSLRDHGDVMDVMGHLLTGMREHRKSMPVENWKQFCSQVCLSHPVRELLNQDPITSRSCKQPRGYPGDAVLMDYLYREPVIRPSISRATPLGRAIFDFLASSPSAQSVRWRRSFLADLIDDVAQKRPKAEILSVASGHMREAQKCQSVAAGRVKRFVAFDQDIESLKCVHTEQRRNAIQCVHGSVRSLIRRKVQLGSFDLVYAAGLYDYLPDRPACKLTEILFEMLKPGGRLVVANFVPNIRECGYMEAFMRWELIYRTPTEFENLHTPLRHSLSKTLLDDNEYVVYLEFRRR